MVIGFYLINLPLQPYLPNAYANCYLGTSAEIIDTAYGVGSYSVALGSGPSWLGLAFHQQILQLELDANSAWFGTSASNAVRAVVGSN